MKSLKYLVVCSFSALLLMNCGGKEEKKKEGFTYEKNAAETPVTKTEVASDEANIVISANDLMKFDKNEIKVKAGQKVKLTLRHIGKLNKQVMGHNFVLLKQGADIAVFAGKAAISSATEYIPEGDDVLVHTKLIGGGETAVIEFDAPAAGTYDFLCSFPGHYAMMKGKFIVE